MDPELATQLEGLLSGLAFSGVAKKTTPIPSAELEKFALAAFNIVEITSFMMAAIGVIEGGLEKVASKAKGTALATLMEYKPFLGSVDKASRHIIREALALMSTFMIKQRNVLASCLSTGLPKLFKSKLLKAPLATFEVAPAEIFGEIKQEYDSFIQRKAFAKAVASVGAGNRYSSVSRTFKRKITVMARGSRGRGQNSFQRGSFLNRGGRGQNRGALRGVRRPSLPGRVARGFDRRDRAIGHLDNQAGGPSNVASAPFPNQQQ